MNIYIHELRMGLRSAVYWTAGLIIVMFLFMLMFPFVSKDAALMQELFSRFPAELIELFRLDRLNLASVLGFYGFLSMYILLIGAVFAMKLGISILSEEMRVKATDFLVAKPVKRTKIVTAKLMSVLTFILVQNILYIIFTFVVTHLITDQRFDSKVYLLVNLSLFFIQLFFVAVGLILSVTIKKIKSVLPITLGTVFGFFIIQLLNQSLSDEKLAYLTPFAYFDASRIVETGGYDNVFFLVNLGVVVILTLLTYVIYNNKDMPSI